MKIYAKSASLAQETIPTDADRLEFFADELHVSQQLALWEAALNGQARMGATDWSAFADLPGPLTGQSNDPA